MGLQLVERNLFVFVYAETSAEAESIARTLTKRSEREFKRLLAQGKQLKPARTASMFGIAENGKWWFADETRAGCAQITIDRLEVELCSPDGSLDWRVVGPKSGSYLVALLDGRSDALHVWAERGRLLFDRRLSQMQYSQTLHVVVVYIDPVLDEFVSASVG